MTVLELPGLELLQVLERVEGVMAGDPATGSNTVLRVQLDAPVTLTEVVTMSADPIEIPEE